MDPQLLATYRNLPHARARGEFLQVCDPHFRAALEAAAREEDARRADWDRERRATPPPDDDDDGGDDDGGDDD